MNCSKKHSKGTKENLETNIVMTLGQGKVISEHLKLKSGDLAGCH